MPPSPPSLRGAEGDAAIQCAGLLRYARNDGRLSLRIIGTRDVGRRPIELLPGVRQALHDRRQSAASTARIPACIAGRVDIDLLADIALGHAGFVAQRLADGRPMSAHGPRWQLRLRPPACSGMPWTWRPSCRSACPPSACPSPPAEAGMPAVAAARPARTRAMPERAKEKPEKRRAWCESLWARKSGILAPRP